MTDPMTILSEGGIAAHDLPDEVRDVLATLSEEEARTLVAVQQKVAAATDEVSGFARTGDWDSKAGADPLAPMRQPDIKNGGLGPDAAWGSRGGFIF